MKKFLSVLLIFMLLNAFAVQLSAQDTSGTTGPALGIDAFVFDADAFVYSDYVSALEIDIFAALVNDGTNAINPQTVEVLYDLSGNPSFLLADIEPYGFAIMFRRAAGISGMATSEGAINPFTTARGRKIYAGPMAYIDFYDGVYTNLLTGRELGGGDVRHMQEITASVLSDLPEPSLIQPFSVASERRISNQHLIRNVGFGVNDFGSCGPIAAAIILAYYEKLERANGRPAGRVIPSHQLPVDGEQCSILEREMIERMGVQWDNDAGKWTPTTRAIIARGLNNHFEDPAYPSRRALRMSASSSTDAVNRAVNEIREGRPSIVATDDSPPPQTLFGRRRYFNNHAMVAYGYIASGGRVTHLIVHTGWWHNDWTPFYEYEAYAGWFAGVITVRPPQCPCPSSRPVPHCRRKKFKSQTARNPVELPNS